MYRPFVLVSLAALAGLAGCFPVANYQSARTLGEGQQALGMTFSSTTFTTVDEGEEEERYTIPGVVPEFTYNFGITDDFEFGGRLVPAFLYGELGLKVRVLRDHGFHLAMAPALGQMGFVLDVTTVRLPLLVAFEVHPRFAFTASGNVSMFFIRDGAAEWDDPFTEDEFVTTTGGSVGIEVITPIGLFRPSVEISRAVIGGEQPDDAGDPLEVASIVLHFGVITGPPVAPVVQPVDPDFAGPRATLSWRHRHKPTEP